MNKIFTILTIFLFTVSVVAQVPQKMSYQAVVRDTNGKLVSDQQVGIRVSILQGTTPVYVETHNTKTNLNGLVSIEVGNGTLIQGIVFQSIDWSQGTFFIKTETDPTGGTNYTAIVGTSQLLSVPFALHSKTAESLSGTITETDPIFVGWDKSLGIEISSSQVNDFQSAVSNNPAVLANTAKNSYPAADAAKLAAITGINTGDQDLSGKVDKIEGKGLSTNDYTAAEQSKLAAIAPGAEVNVQADWNQTDNAKDDFIKNKPINVSSFTNDAIYLKASNNLSDVLNAGNVRTNLGLGTMATQESNAVAISGGALNGTTIGGSAPSAGSFTVLASNDNTVLGDNASDVVDVKGALRIESGTPAVGKVLTSDASGNATWKSPTSPMEITRSRFLLTNDLGGYIINGQSLEENVDITDYRNQFIAPFDGRLVKIVVKTDSPMGNTVIKMLKNHNPTEIESQTVNVAAANTAYTFNFTAATFLAGDDLEIYVDPTSVGANGSKVSFSIVWQY